MMQEGQVFFSVSRFRAKGWRTASCMSGQMKFPSKPGSYQSSKQTLPNFALVSSFLVSYGRPVFHIKAFDRY
jgi:hypothetical protein